MSIKTTAKRLDSTSLDQMAHTFAEKTGFKVTTAFDSAYKNTYSDYLFLTQNDASVGRSKLVEVLKRLGYSPLKFASVKHKKASGDIDLIWVLPGNLYPVKIVDDGVIEAMDKSIPAWDTIAKLVRKIFGIQLYMMGSKTNVVKGSVEAVNEVKDETIFLEKYVNPFHKNIGGTPVKKIREKQFSFEREGIVFTCSFDYEYISFEAYTLDRKR